MNKNQGLTAGLVLAAALMLRPGGGTQAPPPAQESSSVADQTGSTTKSEASEGPWIASCNYWAPARPSKEPPAREPEISGTINQMPVDLHLDLHDSAQPERGCMTSDRVARWGLPGDFDQINVKALIAFVPDPVHTHLGLAFDRTVDALLSAGSDNGYTPSYFWLPWRSRGGALKLLESSSDFEPGHDPERERQPGLIILKNLYKDVIYVFLVSETASEGVNGVQLQNAFQYESDLKQSLGTHFSTGNSPEGKSRVAIVGPTYSGSGSSLRGAIDLAAGSPDRQDAEFRIAGVSYTSLPLEALTSNPKPPYAISYVSFGDDANYSYSTFLNHLSRSGYDLSRVASLIEDNTAYASRLILEQKYNTLPLTIRFPRDISSLRNASNTADQSQSGSALPPGISPYLRFSVRDYSRTQDGIPEFSHETTPLSQEAQLMTIARYIHRRRIQFVWLNASNELDTIFLAQFLHRACPEATLVYSNDLLTVRDIDSEPFVGSVSIGPYPLMSLGKRANTLGAFTSTTAYSYYNAVSYTLWDNGLGKSGEKAPVLAGYKSQLSANVQQPPLWATAVGKDGYYPLGILSPCSSQTQKAKPGDPPPPINFLPRFDNRAETLQKIDLGHPDTRQILSPWPQNCTADQATIPPNSLYPSLLWDLICAVVILLCSFHALMVEAARYWLPFSRDLVVGDNDQPLRRSSYIRVAAGMLLAIAFVVAFPVLHLAVEVGVNPMSTGLSILALVAGFLAAFLTFRKTHHHYRRPGPVLPPGQRTPGGIYDAFGQNFYLFLNPLMVTAIAAILCLWGYLCFTGSSPRYSPDFAGLSFAYRSINPLTGISPLEPVLLLLLGWYFWAMMQTKRLRFSESARPKLPKRLGDPAVDRRFLSDEDLAECETPRQACLYKSITCLMITRQLFKRFFLFRKPGHKKETFGMDIAIALIGGLVLALVILFLPVRFVDHFMWNTGPHLPSPYEFLVVALMSTLVVMCLGGGLRMIVIWQALKRGVLNRLENLPIRFAFSRFKGMGWMTMLRQSGLEQQWKDMSRSLESMSHMRHQSCLSSAQLESRSAALMSALGRLRHHLDNPSDDPGKHDYDFMEEVEDKIAAFGQFLLSSILIPYWENDRIGLVEGREKENAETADSAPPPHILAAEEFLVIRYISLITAVLANLRYLMTFVTASYVLAFLAWNSSALQPHQVMDWAFTILLAILGVGFIVVFAQMHRNAILSRITDTKANELGWDFYFRIVSFGALPVVTWLAYQFPDFGNMIYRFIQPAVPVIK